ncbi:MAG: class I SAM-dependent methyltransferase [Nanoarchaeota archaeon]|nr:class I SAM-dependent methyltransferase [Nanoarchaeota archaeon]
MTWDDIFKSKGKVFYKPHKEVYEAIKLMKKEGVKTVLDLGSGSGRHTILLANEGFDVYAVDNSESGLKQTRKWLKELKLKAVVKNASCYREFPYKNNFFDAVISVQVIHHAKLEDIIKCIKEIERVLKPGGIIFVTVTRNKMKGRASKVKLIAPRTYVMLDGPEKGVPHYIYTKALLKKYFNNFKILDIFIDAHNHYCILGKLKSYS